MSCYIHNYTILFVVFFPKMETPSFEQYSNVFLMGVNTVIVLVLVEQPTNIRGLLSH